MTTRSLTTYREMAHIVDTLPVLMREARRARGLSIRAAAKQLDIANSTIVRIERGEDYNCRSLSTILRWLDTP